MAAERMARDPRCSGAVDALNLRIDRAPWGCAFVEFAGPTYQPAPGGDGAVIVAAEANGELVDLVACRLRDRTMATRLGHAAILGDDAIEASRGSGRSLVLWHDAFAWMHAGFLGAVMLDWRQARWILADVPGVICSSKALATKLHAAMKVPERLPAISYAEARHAA